MLKMIYSPIYFSVAFTETNRRDVYRMLAFNDELIFFSENKSVHIPRHKLKLNTAKIQ